ncbi:hypothetical protein NDU88_006134 [Pleurodeles waltl]|uniref:Uncharacterized protein n=1 Tax=Pleurodeles waltl TaxID=8319 RepID=A0AAV7PHR8_PLEWA|nr:hypothetical protein NDU88_006134 [Pleurodeles waltl]
MSESVSAPGLIIILQKSGRLREDQDPRTVLGLRVGVGTDVAGRWAWHWTAAGPLWRSRPLCSGSRGPLMLRESLDWDFLPAVCGRERRSHGQPGGSGGLSGRWIVLG